MDKRLILAVCGCFLVSLIYSLMKLPSSEKEIVDPWTQVTSQIEKHYGYNKEIKAAALKFATVVNQAIETPEKAQEIDPQLTKATSCLHAVLTKNKIEYTSLKTQFNNKKFEVSATDTKVSNESAEQDAIDRIREISITGDSSRIKDYIKFNSHLSRKIASVASTPQLSDCESN